MTQLQMSARGFQRVLKLAHHRGPFDKPLDGARGNLRASLAGSDAIKVRHLAEALQYRPRRQET